MPTDSVLLTMLTLHCQDWRHFVGCPDGIFSWVWPWSYSWGLVTVTVFSKIMLMLVNLAGDMDMLQAAVGRYRQRCSSTFPPLGVHHFRRQRQFMETAATIFLWKQAENLVESSCHVAIELICWKSCVTDCKTKSALNDAVYFADTKHNKEVEGVSAEWKGWVVLWGALLTPQAPTIQNSKIIPPLENIKCAVPPSESDKIGSGQRNEDVNWSTSQLSSSWSF